MTTINEFLSLYERYESDSSIQNEIQNQIEELASKVLRESDKWVRPSECNPMTWSKAQEVFNVASHLYKKGKTQYILGFLPIILDTLDGVIESGLSKPNWTPLSDELKKGYEQDLTLHPVWITSSTLESADVQSIQKLLVDLINKKDIDEIWHSPESIMTEVSTVRTFFMPVTFKVPVDNLSTGWDLYDIYEAGDFTDEWFDNLEKLFVESVYLKGDSDTRVNFLDIGSSFDVIYEGTIERDMRECTSRLEILKEFVTEGDEKQHEARVEIHLTWGAIAGNEPEIFDVPSIQFLAMARNVTSNNINKLVVSVHTDPRDMDGWKDQVARLFAVCFKVGWVNVVVRQFSQNDTLMQWAENNTSRALN